MTIATFKWTPSNSRGNVLTTELNSLANGAFSAVGPVFDNRTNLDEWAAAEIILASLLPTTGGYLQLFIVNSLDASNYEDPPSSTNPGSHMLIATVSVNVSTSAKRIITPEFRLPFVEFKFVLKNSSGVAFAASGNTVSVTTGNEQGT